MVNMNDLKIEVFADGADLASMLELNDNVNIRGFTTNPSLMKKAGVKDYKNFAIELSQKIQDKPLSFEVFADDINQMEDQAHEINSWGKNINVKIPITNTKGVSTNDLIWKLTSQNIKCNVTAIFTIEQVKNLLGFINKDTYTIISIFAGRIADTGIDPIPLMQEAVDLTKLKANIKILWASPRELLNIFHADDSGCHIITVPSDILKKMNLINKNLDEFSLETVKMFYDDARNVGYKI